MILITLSCLIFPQNYYFYFNCKFQTMLSERKRCIMNKILTVKNPLIIRKFVFYYVKQKKYFSLF